VLLLSDSGKSIVEALAFLWVASALRLYFFLGLLRVLLLLILKPLIVVFELLGLEL
jgi:hypothetical protein